MSGHKNPNSTHNYRDEIELYQGISKRNTLWHSTPEERTPKTSATEYDGVLAHQCTMSHGTYIRRMPDYTIEIYIWNQTEKNKSIISSNKASWRHQPLVYMYMSL